MMMKRIAKIKEATPSGNASHIPMLREDRGKKFLVLPESSKYVLEEIMKKYHSALEEKINPKLNDILTKKELSVLEKLTGDIKVGYKRVRSLKKILDTFKIPDDLKKKLISEYLKTEKDF